MPTSAFEIVPKINIIRGFLDILKNNTDYLIRKMGGGCIFDLGCYTLSFLQLLTNLENVKILNKNLYNGSKSVEIDAKIKISLDDNIIAQLHSSFIDKIDQTITIKGSKGDIIIKNLWSGISTTVLVNKNYRSTAEFQIPFSNQIDQINNCIIEENHNFENLPYSKFKSLNNIKLIEQWRN